MLLVGTENQGCNKNAFPYDLSVLGKLLGEDAAAPGSTQVSALVLTPWSMQPGTEDDPLQYSEAVVEPLTLEYEAPEHDTMLRNGEAARAGSAGTPSRPAHPEDAVSFRFDPKVWEQVHLKDESNLIFYEGGLDDENDGTAGGFDEIQEQFRESEEIQASGAHTQSNSAEHSCMSAPFYFLWGIMLRILQPYFEIDSSDVMLRLSRSFVPIRPLLAGEHHQMNMVLRLHKIWTRIRQFSQARSPETAETNATIDSDFSDDEWTYSRRADLYGPFWIATTLILLLSLSGTVSHLLHRASVHTVQTAKASTAVKPVWKTSEIIRLTVSAAIIYGYELLAATVLWALRLVYRSQGQVPPWTTMLCVVGYAQGPLVPASLLALFPYQFFQFVVMVVAFALSVGFLARNLLIEPLAGADTSLDAGEATITEPIWLLKQRALVPALVAGLLQIGFAIWCVLFIIL